MLLRKLRIFPVVVIAALFALGPASPAEAAPLADSAILLIGDGMGPVQIDLAREAAGGQPLAMQRLPFGGCATTHSADREVTDSAAAGTALATGHKTNNGMISVTPDGRPLKTILELCRDSGKATGIVTTDALQGATPAVFAAHVTSRGMRADIAAQLATSGSQVMLGFWKDWFLPESAGGKRTDGRDLIAEMQRAGYGVAFTRTELGRAKQERLLGLFGDGPQSPTLAQMVTAALERLATDPDGFFLMGEGARIDWKCHDNDPAGSVLDTLEFDQAVAAAVEFARKRGRTLVVVTADHETGGLAIEQPRKVSFLSRVKASSEGIAGKLNEKRANIHGVMAAHAGLNDLTAAEAEEISKAKDPAAAISAVLSRRAGVTWSTGGHTATPVRVFAFGPGAERFEGEMDNTDIPKRIAAALSIPALPQQLSR